MTSSVSLKNGFKLVYQKSNTSIPISVLMVYVKFGSIHEDDIKGIAHFIEHLCFKGTLRLPKSKEITNVYDKIGAFLNAFTYKEYTCYVVKCNDEYTANCIDVLSDMILNSQLKKRDCDLERNVVKEESIRTNDSPQHHISLMIHRMLYGSTPYAIPVDDIENHLGKTRLPYKDVLEMYDKFYNENNMGISVVTNLSFSAIRRMVDKSYFSRVTQAPKIPKIIYQLSPNSDIQYEIMKKKGISATHLCICFRIGPYGHPDIDHLYLLANILGGYMSSRMFLLLREKHGITYKNSASLTCYEHFGHFEIYTVCDHTKLMKNNIGVLDLLIHLLNELIKNGITQKELQDAKGNIKGRIMQSMEDQQIACEHNGLELIVYDKSDSVPYKDYFKKKYETITKKDMNMVIRKYFKKNGMCISILGENVPQLGPVKICCSKLLN